MSWKKQHSNNAVVTRLYMFHVIPIKILARLSIDVDKLALKLIWTGTGLKIAKAILAKQNKVRGVTDFEGFLHRCSNQESIILVKGLVHRAKGQDRGQKQTPHKNSHIIGFPQGCKTNSVEEEWHSQQMLLEQLDNFRQKKKKSESKPHIIYENELKIVKNKGLNKEFVNLTPKARPIKGDSRKCFIEIERKSSL